MSNDGDCQDRSPKGKVLDHLNNTTAYGKYASQEQVKYGQLPRLLKPHTHCALFVSLQKLRPWTINHCTTSWTAHY